MNWNRGGFLHAVATVAIGVAFCVAAANASANARAMKNIKIKGMDGGSVSGMTYWVDVLSKPGEESETTWFLLPDPGEGNISADDALAQLSDFLTQTKGAQGAMNPTALGTMGVVNAIVPSMHGVAPQGLRYELTDLDEQSRPPAMQYPGVVANYGAAPVSFAKAALEAGDVQWEPEHVVTMIPAGKPLSPGAKFRLTEVPVQEARELLQDSGFEVVTQQTVSDAAMANRSGFTKEVEVCIAESSTPILECYNLYLGRDRNARLFEEVYKAVADDRYNYGPFMSSPLERVERLGLE